MSGSAGPLTTPSPHDVPAATLTHPSRDKKGRLEELLSMAKFFPHSFYDIGLVMHPRSQSRWTAQVSTDSTNTLIVPIEELRSQRENINTFDTLVAGTPESVEVYAGYKENMHRKTLIQKFRKAAADARQQDASGLKHKTILHSL
ncbi:hypothetical protein B0H19DRAFT_1080116 [Mycena capillaripes]|nr:hypothetical protein B0H19DRAFT_1080116 [Mycena capillaripes]